MPENSLILDTCALLWLASDNKRLSATARHAIDAAPVVYVSAITAWEVGLKAARGELDLPMPPRDWFAAAVKQHRLTPLSLDPDTLMAANELPWHHREPADRFIIAAARSLKLKIVTADSRFAAYGVTVIC